jgi:membrane associated rhomboid family serine protease
MGMIGLFIYLMPTARIRCLFIFIIYFRVFLLPAWLLAAWYVGWDMYALFVSQANTNINLVAHVSGAIGGYMIGLFFFRKTKKMITPQLKKMIY